MILWIRTFFPAVLLLSATIPSLAQGEDKVDVFTSVARSNQELSCSKFELGTPVESVLPEYPAEASSKRLGGAVRLTVTVAANGTVMEINTIDGPEPLQEASRAAARATKFTQSKCDGKPVPVIGILIFNFVPIALTDVYTQPSEVEDFADVTQDSPYYESILTLTENYQLAFGYADGMYHSSAPLTKGDFAHYLRLTLDLLQQRAEVAKKIPREIDLYFPLNPLGLKTSKDIRDLDSRKPYADSVGFLISKYDIALADKKRNFRGMLPVTQNEVIDYWKSIFGSDAVPVNFTPIKVGDQIMTRGEFSLFLQESLYVLTYKVLP